MSLEAWLLLSTSLLLLFFCLIDLDWKSKSPIYIVFFLATGLLNTLVSHLLVRTDYLAFPWRFWHELTLNNLLYDFFMMPGLGLLLIRIADRYERPGLGTALFAGVISMQDVLVSRYTSLLVMKKWTVLHSASSAVLAFWIWRMFYHWLDAYFSEKRSNA